MEKPVITIAGIGYVGLSFAAVLSNVGYKVYALDVDERKVSLLKKGKAHFSEAGLDELIQKGIDNCNLVPTISYQEALKDADIVFSCVGTPDLPDGSSNLEYIFQVATEVVKYGKEGVILVQKSTVPVGTGGQIIDAMRKQKPKFKFSYVSNPEFLAEGSAIYDTFVSDRVIVGGNDEKAVEQVVSVYADIDNYKTKVELDGLSAFAYIYKNKKKGKDVLDKTPVVRTTLESAELIKVTSNAFLSLKISFANSIAKLCDKSGANIVEVMDGVGLDSRIGRSFLYAGRGYGGGCFPKDVSGLIKIAEKYGVRLPIMDASVGVNSGMPEYVVNKIADLRTQISELRVGVLGITFKPGTSDVRKSPAVEIVRLLLERGCEVVVYDPKGMEEADW